MTSAERGFFDWCGVLVGLVLNSKSSLTSRENVSSPPHMVAGLVSEEKWVIMVTVVFSFSAQLYDGDVLHKARQTTHGRKRLPVKGR